MKRRPSVKSLYHRSHTINDNLKATWNKAPNGTSHARRPAHQSPVRHTTVTTMIFTLSLLERLADCTPLPGLKGAIGACVVMVQAYDDAELNRVDLDELMSLIDSLNNLITTVFDDTSATGRGLTDDLGAQLFKLSEELSAIKKQIGAINKHNKLRRMIEAKWDAQNIDRGFRRVHSIVKWILAGSALRTEATLADIWTLGYLDKLPRANDANYDSINRPMCSGGTRHGVLTQIMQWVKSENSHQIYWLNGAAGTGKTTIALTVANMLAKDPTIFSASFFCSRESESRSDIKLIFPTFAYLLAYDDMDVRNIVVRAIRESPDIGHSLPKEQLSKLLFGPLREVYTGSQRPIVLIIDALDECTGDHASETILAALAPEIRSVPFLKVFVSSRPTASTNEAYSDEALRLQREVFVLQNVEKDVVDADIYDYVMERLSKKAKLRRVSTNPWPPPELIRTLVKMAGGFFIFASTVCEFIEARGDLEFRLGDIIGRSITEYTRIDELYWGILNRAVTKFPDSTTVDQCRVIIGTIILLQNPLSCHDLGQLVCLPPKHIQGILGDLQSVLSVPDSPDDSIRTLHTSFSDFVLTKARCLPTMYVEPATQHHMITLRLLEIMQDGLKRNMAYYAQFKLNRGDHFPGSLRYACRFWADHLSRAAVQDDLILALDRFTSTNLPYCLEVIDSISNPVKNLWVSVIGTAKTWLDKPEVLPTQSLERMKSLEVEIPLQNQLYLFGLSSDTQYTELGLGKMCSEGTRNDVLERILRWSNDASTTQLYWLTGAGGTGKTTIAMTIAYLLYVDRSKLTATFFCSHYSKYRRQVRHLFVTLAMLLATRNKCFREQLVQAVEDHPGVIQFHPKDQFRILIVEPIQRAGLAREPIVFVIDALDEYRHLENGAPAKVLAALRDYLHMLPSLKVLISCRPSSYLDKGLYGVPWGSPITQFNLNDVEPSLVNADIRRYLLEVLCASASTAERLSPSWPPDDLLDKLVIKAEGSFTHASFLGQRSILVGAQKLKEVADDSRSEYEGYLGLNTFYSTMLKWVLRGRKWRAGQYKTILGLLTHLYEPLTVQDFGKIINLPLQVLHLRLLRLQPIVIVSHDTQLMRPLHKFVQHWLTDHNRALPPLLVEPAEMHQLIFISTIDCMTTSLGQGNVPVQTGEANRNARERGSGLLDYACRYWADHLEEVPSSLRILNVLEPFLETKLTLWIERLHGLDRLMTVTEELEKARMWYLKVLHPRNECFKALTDAQQLTERLVLDKKEVLTANATW